MTARRDRRDLPPGRGPPPRRPAAAGPAFSHAVRKGPMLTGPDHGAGGLYRPERITDRIPSAAELAVARRALDAVPGGPGDLRYARADLIPGPDGAPLLVELELTEPSLFLAQDPVAADRLAAAIAARLDAALPPIPDDQVSRWPERPMATSRRPRPPECR